MYIRNNILKPISVFYSMLIPLSIHIIKVIYSMLYSMTLLYINLRTVDNNTDNNILLYSVYVKYGKLPFICIT